MKHEVYESKNGTKVVIDLGDVGTQKLQVKYTTTITDFTINEFNNTVEITCQFLSAYLREIDLIRAAFAFGKWITAHLSTRIGLTF